MSTPQSIPVPHGSSAALVGRLLIRWPYRKQLATWDKPGIGSLPNVRLGSTNTRGTIIYIINVRVFNNYYLLVSYTLSTCAFSGARFRYRVWKVTRRLRSITPNIKNVLLRRVPFKPVILLYAIIMTWILAFRYAFRYAFRSWYAFNLTLHKLILIFCYQV